MRIADIEPVEMEVVETKGHLDKLDDLEKNFWYDLCQFTGNKSYETSTVHRNIGLLIHRWNGIS